MKKTYARIDFENCNTDFDYTICEWQEVSEYMDLVKQDAEDLDDEGFKEWEQKGYLPTAKLSIVMLTADEFSEWFTKNVEAKNV